MSVRLRLRRVGAKNQISFRIVAADQRSPRDGRFIEVLGFYDPRGQNEKVDLERAEHWIKNGAQPTQTVTAIINRARKGSPMTPAAKPAKPFVDTTKKPAPAPMKKKEEPKAEEAPVAAEAAPAAEAAAGSQE